MNAYPKRSVWFRLPQYDCNISDHLFIGRMKTSNGRVVSGVEWFFSCWQNTGSNGTILEVIETSFPALDDRISSPQNRSTIVREGDTLALHLVWHYLSVGGGSCKWVLMIRKWGQEKDTISITVHVFSNNSESFQDVPRSWNGIRNPWENRWRSEGRCLRWWRSRSKICWAHFPQRREWDVSYFGSYCFFSFHD